MWLRADVFLAANLWIEFRGTVPPLVLNDKTTGGMGGPAFVRHMESWCRSQVRRGSRPLPAREWLGI